jgi:mycothiol system anti-sigma-R factor
MSSLGFGPGGIDCEHVLQDLFLYLDDETDPLLKNRMREHLDDCAPCLRRLGLEQEVKSLVARCCGAETAPTELRDRIRIRITEVSVETGRQEYLPE